MIELACKPVQWYRECPMPRAVRDEDQFALPWRTLLRNRSCLGLLCPALATKRLACGALSCGMYVLGIETTCTRSVCMRRVSRNLQRLPHVHNSGHCCGGSLRGNILRKAMNFRVEGCRRCEAACVGSCSIPLSTRLPLAVGRHTSWLHPERMVGKLRCAPYKKFRS